LPTSLRLTVCVLLRVTVCDVLCSVVVCCCVLWCGVCGLSVTTLATGWRPGVRR